MGYKDLVFHFNISILRYYHIVSQYFNILMYTYSDFKVIYIMFIIQYFITGGQTTSPWLSTSSAATRVRRTKRRPYSKLQILELEKAFQENMYLSRDRRTRLSETLNLSERQVGCFYACAIEEKKLADVFYFLDYLGRCWRGTFFSIASSPPPPPHFKWIFGNLRNIGYCRHKGGSVRPKQSSYINI